MKRESALHSRPEPADAVRTCVICNLQHGAGHARRGAPRKALLVRARRRILQQITIC